MRVLTEGTQTFDLDGHGEDVGVTLEHFPGMGIGLPNTIDVVFEATLRAADLYASTGDQVGVGEWVDLLRESGCDLGFCAEIETALGIGGFFSDWYQLPYLCDGAPSASDFTAWQRSDLKEFVAFKDRRQTSVLVLYHVGTNPVLDRIRANTDAAPAVIEYGGRLYVFWRSRANGSISFLWYEPDGSRSVVHTIADMRADGAFDVAVFDGRLHVIYTDDHEVRLGWCAPLAAGGDCAWHRYADGSHSKGLGVFAFPGLGADAGPGLAGTSDPDEEHLYIATAFAGPHFVANLEIYQVDRQGDLEHAVWMPDYYPSFQTLDEIAVRVVKSAFPNGNYLYLAWRDAHDGKLYKAVLRHLDDAAADFELGHADYWITWSNDTFMQADSGVRLKKGPGTATTGVDFFFELADRVGIARQLGLY